jgi:hypothetical protein
MSGTERCTQTNHPTENFRYPSRANPSGRLTARAVAPMRIIMPDGVDGNRDDDKAMEPIIMDRPDVITPASLRRTDEA